MAQTHTTEEARQRFNSLPQEVKNLLYSQEMALILQKVGEKNQLHIDQIDALYTETGQLMLGFAETQEFIEDLVDILKVDQKKAEAIAKDVDEMLFFKIRDAMKAFYEAHKEQPTIATPPEQPVSKLPPLPDRSGPQQIISSTPVAAPQAPVVAPVSSPTVPLTPPATPPVVPPPPIKPMAASPTATNPDLHAADMVLNEKTITPPSPGNYKKDPYREPIE